ncbi:MAG: ribosome-associated translation inhibitor RaiA [Candidatus Brocadiaceae bacterium]
MEDITIVARHLNITEAIQQYALQKAGKIKKIFEWILHIQITLDIGGDNSHLVEMIVSISRGAPLVAKASDSDMYRAIDLVVDKVESQLKKHKGKIQSRIVRRKRPTTIGMEDFQDIPEA